MWCISTKEYQSAFKKKQILQHATTWMSLDIILSEYTSQRKTNTARFHLYESFCPFITGEVGSYTKEYYNGLKFED